MRVPGLLVHLWPTSHGQLGNQRFEYRILEERPCIYCIAKLPILSKALSLSGFACFRVVSTGFTAERSIQRSYDSPPGRASTNQCFAALFKSSTSPAKKGCWGRRQAHALAR